MKIINVLSPEVFKDCHIKGSINVPFDELAGYADSLSADEELVVHCASYVCPMSKRAWHLLRDKGFANVRAYEGGTAEWYALGLPTEGPATQAYLKEHYDQPSTNGEVDLIEVEELREKLGV